MYLLVVYFRADCLSALGDSYKAVQSTSPGLSLSFSVSKGDHPCQAGFAVPLTGRKFSFSPFLDIYG